VRRAASATRAGSPDKAPAIGRLLDDMEVAGPWAASGSKARRWTRALLQEVAQVVAGALARHRAG